MFSCKPIKKGFIFAQLLAICKTVKYNKVKHFCINCIRFIYYKSVKRAPSELEVVISQGSTAMKSPIPRTSIYCKLWVSGTPTAPQFINRQNDF